MMGAALLLKQRKAAEMARKHALRNHYTVLPTRQLQPIAPKERKSANVGGSITGAVIGGTVGGFIFGPIGAVIGAVIAAVIGSKV